MIKVFARTHTMPEQAFDRLILDALDQAGNIVAVMEVAAVRSGLRVLSANVALSHALGRSVADIEGSSADFLIGDDADPARLIRLQTALRLNEPLQETLSLQISGRQVWIGMRLMPTASLPPSPRRFVLLGRDITERRRRAAADEAMQLLLGQAFRQAEIAMAVVETSGGVVMSNYHFQKLCGRQASGIDGLNLASLLHPDDVPEAISRRERQLVDGKSYDIVVRVTRPGDEVLPVRLHFNILEHRNLRRLRIVTLTPIETSDESVPGQAASEAPSHPVVLAGGIQLIGLEGVRQTLGDRWPALAERVMATADNVLRAHLLPGEVFSHQSNGTGYVVRFIGSDVEKSEARAATITREIRTRLLSEMDDARFAATTLALNPQPIPQADLVKPAATLSALLEQQLNQRQAALEDQARARLAKAATGGKCILIPATTPAAVPVSLALIDLPKLVRRSLDTAMLTLPEAEMRGFDPTRLRLAGLAEVALKQDAADRAAAWILPVDYDSMTLRYRREQCLEHLSALPTALRQRLTPLLSQLPQSVYEARVDETLRVLKVFGRAVGIEVDDLDALPFDPKRRSVGLVMVKGATLLNLLRRNRAAAVAATFQRLRAESIRVVARDTADLSAADLTKLGVDFLVNEDG